MDGSTGKAHISVRLPTDVLEELDRIADGLILDRHWVILRALTQYLDREGADFLREMEGIAALNRGEGVDFDTVQDEAETIVAEARANRHQADT